MAETFDVVVVGGGPGGYVCAIRAAQLGLKTAVVERERLGGICLNWGCIPTKALLRSSEIFHLMHRLGEFGFSAENLKIDFQKIVDRSRKVSQQLSNGVAFLMKKHKITVLKGEGTLQGAKSVKVGAEVHTATKAVVLATGSRVKGIPQIGLELNRTTVISSDEALLLEQAPASLAIVGAGAVGTEFADIFNAFGTRVTLIEVLPRILPIEDAESSAAIARSFNKRKIQVLAGAKVSQAMVAKDKVTLKVESGGKTETIEVDKVLMAAGRAVNTESPGFKESGVQVNDRGFVKVNPATLETTVKGVYCIGDVAGPPMLAHKGSREGVFVAELIAGRQPHPIRYDNIPSVTYCHPEVASIGLTEEQCQQQKLDFQIGKFPFTANGRARTAGETEGLVKVIRDKRYGEILGAHIVGAHASEIIHELAVARENEYTVEEVDLAVHAHPTLSEAVAEACLDSMGRALNI